MTALPNQAARYSANQEPAAPPQTTFQSSQVRRSHASRTIFRTHSLGWITAKAAASLWALFAYWGKPGSSEPEISRYHHLGHAGRSQSFSDRAVAQRTSIGDPRSQAG